MVKTPKFDTPFFGTSGQKDGETGNDLLKLFDSLTHPLVLDKDLTSPPGSPDEGATYIVGGSATGAWAGQDNNLAVYFYGSWDFVAPWNGLTVWVDDESVEYRWEGSAWVTTVAGVVASTRTALKALDTSIYTVAQLMEAGREGLFVFRAGNYASQVTADTQEAIYIKADDTATSAGAWVRVYQDALHWTWWGATGDESTDDTTAMNAALAYIRSLEDSTDLLRPVTITGLGKKFLVSGSLNATLIRLGKGWGIRDTWIISDAAGKTVLDLTASRFGYFQNLHIWSGTSGDTADDPHTGILVACADPASTYPCDSHTWINCSVDGYYQYAAYMEYGSEVTSHTGCIFWNRRVAYSTFPCWAVVLQGRDTVDMTSDYQTLETGRVSYTMKNFDLCRFQKPFGIDGPTVYMEDIASTRFTKPYMTSGSDTIVTWDLNSDFVPYQVTFDGLQIETTGTETAFLFTGTATATIRSLNISFGNIFSSAAVFNVSGPTTMNLENCTIDIPRWNGSAPTNVFANASNFKPTGCKISVPAYADLETGFASDSEYEVYAHDAKVTRALGTQRIASGEVIIADASMQGGVGAAMADDTAVTITLSSANISSTGVLFLWSEAAGVAATIHYRASATPAILLESLGSNVESATASALAGTTGTDNKFTIAINNGEIRFENRRGFSVSYRAFFIGYSGSV